MKTQIDCIEGLLLLAMDKGHGLRNTSRKERRYLTRGENVGILLHALDEHKTPWSVQNNALMFLNDVDLQGVWDALHRSQLRDMATRIASGESFGQIING
jgi:hypothetical protein